MHKYLLVFMMFFVTSFGLVAQGIKFEEGTWEDALAKAKEGSKLIFVDAYTTWCGPCKAMSANVFPQKEAGDFFNANFINLKIDMEKDMGRAFGKKYPISAYPTLLFIDSEGVLVSKVVGGRDVAGLVAAGSEALKKGANTKAFDEKYLAGDRSYPFMLKYVTSLSRAGKSTTKIMNDYLNSKPSITDAEMGAILFESVDVSDGTLFEKMQTYKASIIAQKGQAAYDAKVVSACRATVKRAVELELATLVDEAIGKAKQNLSTGAKELESELRMDYAKGTKSRDGYLKYAETYASQVIATNPIAVQTLVADMCNNFQKDQQIYASASKVAKLLYDKDKNFNNLMMYSYLLTTTGKTKDALKLVEDSKKSLKADDASGQANHNALLDKIKTFKG